MISPFNFFLKNLAEVLQFSSLVSDAQGACLIKLKESGLTVLFEFDDQLLPHSVLFSSPILEVPLSAQSVVYEALLIGNHGIEETLSLQPDSSMVYLHKRVHPDITVDDLNYYVNSFIDKSKEWRRNIETIILGSQKTPTQFHHIPSIKIFPRV